MRQLVWKQELLLLLALGAALPVALAGSASHSAALSPEMVYFPTPLTALAPNTALGGTGLGPPLPAVGSAEECAAACRNTTGCSLFQWCGNKPSCITGSGSGRLPYQACQLLGNNCTVEPVVEAQGWPVQVASGFPVHPAPVTVSGFTEVPGNGILGADFSCPMSVLPGQCAYSKLLDGATMCVDATDCVAVVWYFNGTDGCSAPVAVLKKEGLSPGNTFLAPGVATLQQQDSMPEVSSRLYYPDGEVLLPSDAELAAAMAEVAASGRGLGNDTTWMGGFVGRNAILDGEVVQLVDGVPTADACCRRCRALERNGSGGVCNAFNYCNATAGCTYTDARQQTYALRHLDCEMRFQPLVVPSMGWPPNLLAKGPGVPFYGGAPIAVWGPQQPGYERYLGFGLFTYGRFNCTGSLSPQLQECAHMGSIESHVTYCEADPECVGFVFKPGGLFLSGPSVGIFKHATNPAKILFNPTGVLYLREDMGGSSSLSAGAIAGIAVGSAAAAAALACAAWLLMRRRRRRRAASAAAGKAAEASCSSGRGDCETGGEPSDQLGRSLPLPPPSEQQLPAQQLPAQPGSQSFNAAWMGRRPSGSLVSPFTASAAAAAIFGNGGSKSRSSSIADADGDAVPAPAAARVVQLALRTATSTVTFTGSGGSGPGSQGSTAATLGPSPGRVFDRPPRPPGSQRVSFDEAALAHHDATLVAAGAGPRVPSLQPPPTPSELGSRQGSSAAALAAQQQRYHQQLHLHASSACLTSGGKGTAGNSSLAAFDREPSGVLTSSTQLGSAAPLPELVQHVAAQDVLAVGSAGTSDGSISSSTHIPVSAESLPPRLREWLVDPSLVEYLRWPNGKLQELGMGASAHVYRAMYNGEVIAAKEIEIDRSLAMQEAFLTEALRLQALRHPHIVSFYGVMLRDNRGVVLMEFCEGRDLHSALELKAAGTEQRLFGWQRRGRRVAFDVAKALNYLHSKGVVHMDVKSSNVLLTASGTAKLADVAFSRLQTGTFLSDLPLIGTFAWVAPEVLLGGRQCTQAVDIYSFGVVLWEIVTGERPQRGCMRSPCVPEECPQEAANLIDRMLSQDPAERPTAQEVLHELGRMLGGAHSRLGAAGRRRSSADGGAPTAGHTQGPTEQEGGLQQVQQAQQERHPAGQLQGQDDTPLPSPQMQSE